MDIGRSSVAECARLGDFDLLAQLFFLQAVELIGPSRASVFTNLVPIFGPMIAIIVLGEPFHLYHALALVLVLGGIALAEWRRPV